MRSIMEVNYRGLLVKNVTVDELDLLADRMGKPGASASAEVSQPAKSQPEERVKGPQPFEFGRALKGHQRTVVCSTNASYPGWVPDVYLREQCDISGPAVGGVLAGLSKNAKKYHLKKTDVLRRKPGKDGKGTLYSMNQKFRDEIVRGIESSDPSDD